MSTQSLVVRELGTDKEVHRIDVSGKPERMVEKIMMGMLINMNTDSFYVDEETAEESN